MAMQSMKELFDQYQKQGGTRDFKEFHTAWMDRLRQQQEEDPDPLMEHRLRIKKPRMKPTKI